VSASLSDVLDQFRPQVRAQHPYLVGAAPAAESKLNQNESPFDLDPDFKRELIERLMDEPFNRYTTEQPERLRAAFARYVGVEPSQVIVSNGSNELTYTLGLCFVAPGRSVVLPTPMFALHQKVAQLYGGDLVSIPPRADFSFDADAIEAAVREHRPSLTILTTPNNPTGLEMTAEEIDRIVAAAAPGIVVVDEAYDAFMGEPSALRLIDRWPNVLVMRTFSKAFGLAGVRLGCLIGNAEVITEVEKSLLPFTVDRLAEEIGLAVLERADLVEGHVAEISRETERLQAALRQMDGVEVLPTAANFMLFKTRLGAAETTAALAGRGVLVRNVSGYPDLPGFVRVSAGTPDENTQFLHALQAILREEQAAA
jgi:histidinol-phosphate aminotransferase